MASEAEPTHLARALEQRDARAAWAAAGKKSRIDLPDSLALVLLLAHDDPENRFQIASARWVARYTVELRATVHETALLASQFSTMQTPARKAAITTLAAWFEGRAQRNLARVAREWAS